MWYGGGCDLTPFYVQEGDFAEFHAFWKALCDRHDAQVSAWTRLLWWLGSSTGRSSAAGA